MAYEVEVDLQYPTFKRALESFLVRVLPLLVCNPECDVLVRRSRVELDDARLVAASVPIDRVRRSLGLVDKVRVEDVELVSLSGLGRWGVVVVVSSVVLVPLVTDVDTVGVFWFPRSVLVVPPVNRRVQIHLISAGSKHRVAFLHHSHGLNGLDLEVDF
ncbi:hypothetical protein LINGRAHAP2_LOCUS25746 [Linum grandiflorum]